MPLAKQGKSCLFLDFDPQRNLTKVLAPDLANDEGFLIGNHEASVINMFESSIKPTPYEIAANVHIIGGNKKLTNINQDNIFSIEEGQTLQRKNFIHV